MAEDSILTPIPVAYTRAELLRRALQQSRGIREGSAGSVDSQSLYPKVRILLTAKQV